MQTILMNWEICLDLAGFGCFVLTVLYLILLKRKSVPERPRRRAPHPAPQENADPFKVTPLELPVDGGFKEVLNKVQFENRPGGVAGGRKGAADSYDEVRRLLDLGMEPHQVAERTKIPQCEIDLIVRLRQMHPEPV